MKPTAAPLKPVVAFNQVSVQLGGNTILHDVSYVVQPGERVAFVGPSGAGKTTLLRLLNGMVSAHSGSVQVEGQTIGELQGKQLRRLRRKVGFVHQDLRLVPNLRVIQNVLSGKLGEQNLWQSIRMFLRPSPENIEEALSLLERVGIPELLFQRTDRLSGGEAQRVALARALIQKPSLLAADEPVSSVDPSRSREILSLLTQLGVGDDLTLCVSLHNPQLVREFFTRVVGLRDGRLVFDVPANAMDAAQLDDLYALVDTRGL